jgi:2-polyprenyl-3-methyl-5-hydroxy-6-metoxy-1,4-benzoquinol methylase
VSNTRVESYTTPRADLLPFLPGAAARVLDVGCSNGAFGAEIKQRLDCIVVGVEIDPGFAREAARRIDSVVCDDALSAVSALRNQRFDCIICADVLEHLVDPGAVLTGLHGVLAPGGTIVVSIPNVRFYDTFVQLGLRGWWPERERGVHDRTHLRWFTDANARALFRRTGFRVSRSSANYRLRDRPDARVNQMAHLVARGPLRPFLAYQLLYVLVANDRPDRLEAMGSGCLDSRCCDRRLNASAVGRAAT